MAGVEVADVDLGGGVPGKDAEGGAEGRVGAVPVPPPRVASPELLREAEGGGEEDGGAVGGVREVEVDDRARAQVQLADVGELEEEDARPVLRVREERGCV